MELTALSRRELVASFLGVAVANAACRSSAPGGQVPGAIVDHAFETGHLLRGPPPPGVAAEVIPVDVLVVGAGVAGLSAAWRLAAAGVRGVTVCELDDAVGGTARSGLNATSAFPWGAHYLPAPLRREGPVARLLAEMGVLTGVDDQGRARYAEEALVAEPEERLFYKGSWYEGLYLHGGASAADLAELARFGAQMDGFAAARDGKGRKAFDIPLRRGSDDAEWTQLDRLSMAQWLEQQGYRSARLRWWVDYACKDDFGTDAAGTSAWAGVWYFAARHEGETARSAGYLSWPEGNGRLVAQLLESSGAQVQRSTLVHTVTPGPGGSRVLGLDAQRRPIAFQARQVVLAAPRFVAGRVYAPWRDAPPAFLSEFEYGPWVVANLTLNAAPRSRGFPLAWDNVLYESKSLGYVNATHQREVARSNGATVLTWYYPLTGPDVRAERTRALGATYAEWEALVMADLAPAHQDLRAQATRLEVTRWGHAMVRPRPGFLWGNARREANQSVGDAVHFAHTDLSGLAMFEEANASGVAAAERALAGLGHRVETWL